MTKNKLVSTNLDATYYPQLVDFARKRGLTLSSAMRLIVIERFDNENPQKQKESVNEFLKNLVKNEKNE